MKEDGKNDKREKGEEKREEKRRERFRRHALLRDGKQYRTKQMHCKSLSVCTPLLYACGLFSLSKPPGERHLADVIMKRLNLPKDPCFF